MANREDRRHKGDRAEDNRLVFQRDRDRVLYTTAFRRLAGVTQVATAGESQAQVFHSRLTHTLEVAQIGSRLAQMVARAIEPDDVVRIGGIDPDVVETACLAHDLGHPPFGHVGEKALRNALVEDAGVDEGFEGNAQSFRIVTQLSLRHDSFPGLNLSRASLCAILKYPTFQTAGHDKYGAYRSEARDFDWARALLPNDDRRSAEAELMDWADDVAYAIHDADDFYRAGLVPLHVLRRDPRERARFLTSALERWRRERIHSGPGVRDEAEEALGFVLALFPLVEPFEGLAHQRSALRTFTAALIQRYVRAVAAAPPRGRREPRVLIDPFARLEVDLLKQLIWEYVIERPSLRTQQHGHARIIRELFLAFWQAASPPEPDFGIFPPGQRELIVAMLRRAGDDETRNEVRARIACDIVASLTESQALHLYQRLYGGAGSVLDRVLV